jgi:pyridoxal phosphate enzyme (YggS family)
MLNEKKYFQLKKYCSENQIDLIAVSKKQPNEKIQFLYDLGHRDFGENRVEEFQKKRSLFAEDIRWHFIGHLQSKKVKLLEPFPFLIHSVDRFKLLDVLEKEGEKRVEKVKILIQIKIAEEDSKYGFSLADGERTIATLIEGREFPHIELKGLMGMATFTEDKVQIASEFKKLADFADKMKKKYPHHQEFLNILSLGMSDDYPIAVAQGSNMIRIGSSIFGPRNYD